MPTGSETFADAVTHHQAGDFRRAGQTYQEILRVDPQHADAWHLSGVVAHQEGNHLLALDRIRRAIELKPHAVSYHSNLGAVYKALGNLDEAVHCYQRALQLDARYAQAHNNLGNALLDQDKHDEAEASFRRALEVHPGYVEAHNNLGLVLQSQGRLREALASYRRAVELNPDFAETHKNLGSAAQDLGRLDDAVASYQRAVQSNPRDPDALASLAGLCERLHRMDKAASFAAEALKIDPQHPLAHVVLAKCEHGEERYQEAIDRLLELRPHVPPSANVAREIEAELGRLYDRVGEAGKAFEHFTEANRLAERDAKDALAERRTYLQTLRELSSTFTRSWVDSWTAAPPLKGRQAPVFLIGFPRSGTTLLDVVLDSHPGIQTMEEKPTMRAVEGQVRALPGGYPAALAGLSAAKIEHLRATYFRMQQRHLERRPGALVVDKLPLNTVHAGLILRVFPAARFIVAVRHPCDVCLSCFMQNFKLNGAMANFFTLRDTALLYDTTMSLWRRYVEVLPHPHHLVRYEDLVEDFEGQTRRLLEFLGLEWSDSVRDYSEHAKRHRSISTPSYQQVTRPIYKQSRNRWHRYAEQLAPVIDILRPYVEYFGYGLDAPA